MTPEQFCYWLQGFAEITQNGKNFGNGPQPHEWKIIVDHLQLVFKKETPNYHDYSIKATPVFDSPKLADNWPHYPHGPLITC